MWCGSQTRNRRLTLLTALVIVAASACAGAPSESARADRTVEQVAVPAEAPAPASTSVAVPTIGPAPAPTSFSIPPTPTPLPEVTRTLLFSGDVLSHTPVIAQALAYGASSDLDYDYRPMFADIAARLDQADLAICVLETPVSEDNIGLDGYPTFEAPRELPDALVAAGYDGCSTASNHSMDRGPSGVRTTLDQMDRVALGHAGMARSATEAANSRIYDLDGVAVAHLSYTYSLNGFVLPEQEPWLVNLNDVDSILAEAERARSAGADVVVLSIQWGNEYQRAPSAEQERLAQELTATQTIDVIVGNHVHVVQPVTVVNEIPVIYGLGNSLSNQSDNCCRTGTQDGVMVEVTVRGNEQIGYRVTGLAFAPTWVDRSNYTIIDLLAALDADQLRDGQQGDAALSDGVRQLYKASFDRTVEAIHSLDMHIPLAD